jgi:hypothetical protein
MRSAMSERKGFEITGLGARSRAHSDQVFACEVVHASDRRGNPAANSIEPLTSGMHVGWPLRPLNEEHTVHRHGLRERSTYDPHGSKTMRAPCHP